MGALEGAGPPWQTSGPQKWEEIHFSCYVWQFATVALGHSDTHPLEILPIIQEGDRSGLPATPAGQTSTRGSAP